MDGGIGEEDTNIEMNNTEKTIKMRWFDDKREML